MIVYFIRHGESVGNASKTYQTPLTPLSANGLSQAQTVANRLRKVHIDHILCSPYTRTVQTAEIIAKPHHLKPEIYESLHEYKRPSEFNGKKIDDPTLEDIQKKIRAHYHDETWKYSDEENFACLKERALQTKKNLEQRKEGHLVCVTHGVFVTMFVAVMMYDDALTSHTYSYFRNFLYTTNTGISIIKYTPAYGWKLLSWNDHAHVIK